MIEFLTPYNIELLILSVAMALVNCYFLLSLIIKNRRLETENKKIVAKIVASFNKEDEMKGPSIFNVKGIVDGGVLIALFGVAMIALITGQETVSKQAIINKQEIKVEDKVYKCHPIRQRMIKYYDLVEQKTTPLPIKKDCK